LVDEQETAMAETMTTALLWVMAVLGVWNGLNMFGRLYYGASLLPYSWHVVSGACAIMILWLR
jgi:hypothetical protein